MNYLHYVQIWHQKHHLTDAIDMSIHHSSKNADIVDYEIFDEEPTLDEIDNIFFSDSIIY